mgnify:CR=1 FL=1
MTMEIVPQEDFKFVIKVLKFLFGYGNTTFLVLRLMSVHIFTKREKFHILKEGGRRYEKGTVGIYGCSCWLDDCKL